MNNPNSGFNRIIHVHGLHDFGQGAETTSHIESEWGNLKNYCPKFMLQLNQRILYISQKNVNGIKRIVI